MKRNKRIGQRGPIPLAWERHGDCLICTSHSRNSHGYPLMQRGKRFMAVCRHILFRRYGEQPPHVVSRHTCDNPACINPDHIIPGTARDNMKDRDERGRLFYGEKVTISKLKEHQVREIRRLTREEKLLPRIVAPMFGVSVSLVKMIRRGDIWKRCV